MENIAESVQRNEPQFWSPRRTQYLHICLEYISKTHPNDCDQKWLDSLLTALLDKDTIHDSKDKAAETLESVLRKLMDIGYYNGPLPATRVRVPRPSVIPSDPEQYQEVERSWKLVDFFWNDWLPQALSSNQMDQDHIYAFAFAFSAAAESSLGHSLIYSILTELTFGDLLNGYSFKTRIHPKDISGKTYPVTLASPTQLLLDCFLQKINRSSGYIFFSQRQRERKKFVIRKLAEQYMAFSAAYAEKYGDDDSIPQSWPRFAKAAQLHTLLNTSIGLEPYIMTILKTYPLPACHPTNGRHRITMYDRVNTAKDASTWKPPQKISVETTQLVIHQATDDENDWVGKSKAILRHFLKRLAQISKNRKITGDRIQATILDELEQARIEADKLTDTRNNALHLAIDWIGHKIASNEISAASTVDKYLRNVFINGMLSDPDSANFSDWEPEDHAELFEDIVSRDSLKSEKSRQSLVSAYKQVYDFGNNHEYFEGIQLKYVAEEWGGSTGRNEIISLKGFDAFIQELIADDDDEHSKQMLAAFLLLAYYGCMRSSEISRLTLKDVSIKGPFLWVNILRGKSASARRRIPFHLMAPEYAQKIIACYYDFRKQQFQKNARLKNIALFGPIKERERYTRDSLAKVAIDLVQARFGKKFVLHSLRHCGCSWLILRMYASRYPDVLELLVDKDHEVFSEPYLKKAVYLFSGEIRKLHPLPCPSGLIRLSKIMGHLGQRTTFSTYIHTFHVIHAHAMKYRVSPVLGTRKLNGNLIAALFPKMKSRTTQAKIKDKSINGLLAL